MLSCKAHRLTTPPVWETACFCKIHWTSFENLWSSYLQFFGFGNKLLDLGQANVDSLPSLSFHFWFSRRLDEEMKKIRGKSFHWKWKLMSGVRGTNNRKHCTDKVWKKAQKVQKEKYHLLTWPLEYEYLGISDQFEANFSPFARQIVWKGMADSTAESCVKLVCCTFGALSARGVSNFYWPRSGEWGG